MWWLSIDEKMKWSPGADKKLIKNDLVTIRMMEDGVLEAHDDVSLINDRYNRHYVGQIVGGNRIIGLKGDNTSSLFLCDEME